MATVRAVALHLEDSLGGLRKVKTTTEISFSDNGSGEAIFSTEGTLIGFRSSAGGYSLSTTTQVVTGDPSEPRYWRLRASRETVTVVVDFQGGDRVQFAGMLAKYEPKGDNAGTVEASVEWVLGEPNILREGNAVT
ncbi:MAG: hypothetical protein MJE77_30345 [Proteobacteria bacterium]|nr:hypothetical protein [Pseudomonadota bacterium]